MAPPMLAPQALEDGGKRRLRRLRSNSVKPLAIAWTAGITVEDAEVLRLGLEREGHRREAIFRIVGRRERLGDLPIVIVSVVVGHAGAQNLDQ